MSSCMCDQHTYIHTYIHTDIHTYRRTYILTYTTKQALLHVWAGPRVTRCVTKSAIQSVHPDPDGY